MDKLKEKLKKGLNLNKSSSGSSSIFSSKPSAFAGTGHRLGTAEPKAPPPPRTAAPPSSSGVPKPPIANASIALSPSAPLIQSPPPPSSPSPPPLPTATEQAPPLIDFTPQADDFILSAIDLLSSDPHCSTSVQIIHRILSNILTNPVEVKYRKVRLNNPKIQTAIVDTHGGVELILACGFVIVFETNTDGQQQEEKTTTTSGQKEQGAGEGEKEKEQQEVEEGFAILNEDADLEPIQAAVALLQKMIAPSIQSNPAQQTAALPPPAASTPAAAPAAAAAAPQKEREWAPPCDRKTQVILPASVDTDVPSWFFERTGQDLKISFLAAVRKREQSQILMTKAMREKAAKNGGILPASGTQQAVPTPSVATVKVRLPEGISLQGEFAAGEPVAVVFAWVADCLCDPLQTFDLVLPDRRILEFNTKADSSNGAPSSGRIANSMSASAIIARRVAERPSSIKEAGLMPSVTVNLRWTGASTVDMKGVPALRRELYTQAAA